MKKLAALLLIVLMIGTVGCFLQKDVDEQPTPRPDSDIVKITIAPSPTAVPTPTPAPQVFVMGDDEGFIDNLSQKCGAIAVDSVENSGGGRLIVVLQGAFATEEQAASLVELGAQVIVCSTEPLNVPNATVIPFEAGEHSEALLDALLVFPPHDTPVRLLGMFSSDMSDLKAIWDSRVEEGKLFAKGVHYDGDTEETAEEWIGRMLEKYVEGTIDGIICETAEQTQVVAAALSAAERLDRIEIFTMAQGNMDSPFVIGYMGADWLTASDLAASVVTAMLNETLVEDPAPFSDKVIVAE